MDKIVRFFLRKLPKNLIMVYSNPVINTIMQKVPKHFNKVFNNVSKKSNKINCFANCIDCLKCYNTDDKTEQIIEAVK